MADIYGVIYGDGHVIYDDVYVIYGDGHVIYGDVWPCNLW